MRCYPARIHNLPYPKTADKVPQPTRSLQIRSLSRQTWRLLELLTARELEALLRIDVKTIYSSRPDTYVRIQSNLRFVRSQIFDWITEHNYHPYILPIPGETQKRYSRTEKTGETSADAPAYRFN